MSGRTIFDWRVWAVSLFLLINASGWVWFVNSQRAVSAALKEIAGAVDVAEPEPVVAEPGPFEEPPPRPAATEPVAGGATPSATESPLMVRNCAASSPAFADPEIAVRFSANVDIAGAGDHLRFEPEVKFHTRQEWYKRELVFAGPFVPGESYTMVLGAGFAGEDGRELGREVRRTLVIPPRRADVKLAAQGRYLAPYGDLTVPVISMNCTQLVSRVARVLPQNLVQLAMREADRYHGWFPRGAEYLADDLGEWLNASTNRIDFAVNQEGRTMISLAEILGENAKRGVFVVRVDGASGSVRPRASRLVCVSDIGISSRRGDSELVIWATSLSTGAPLEGCVVQLFEPNGAQLDQGISDSNGIIKMSLQAGKEPFLLAAQAGDDETFMALRKREGSSARGFLRDGECEAFVFSERGIYRHGEPVFAQALLRDGAGAAVSGLPVVLELVQKDGKVAASKTEASDSAGALLARFDVGEVWRSGRYALRARLPGEGGRELGRADIVIESFAPPQIRVDLEGLPRSVLGDAHIEFGVAARHLFGAPAVGLPGEARLHLTAAPFAPKGWEDWVFGDNERSFAGSTKDLGKRFLDAEGRAVYRAEIETGARPPAAIKGVVQATIMEAGGRPVTASESFLCHAYPYYIGIRKPGAEMFEAGSPGNARFAVVAPDGERHGEEMPLDMRIERIDYTVAMRRGKDGHYEWETQRTLSIMESESGVASGEWSFTHGAPGSYLLTVTEPRSGASSSWGFSTRGEGDSALAGIDMSSPEKVEIICDRDRYEAGDVAHIQLRAPFAGTAWVSVLRDKVVSNHVLPITNNIAELRLPVGDWAPNAEVAVSLVRPAVAESVWRAHRATGKLALKVVDPARRLNVFLEDLPAESLPGRKLPVRVIVRGDDGRPVKGARMSLMAVDEGICLLTDHKTPNPVAWLEAVRESRMGLDDVYRALMPISDERMWGAASHIGGDEDSEMLKRLNPVAARRFKPYARFYGNLEVGADGALEAELELPEFAGEVRVMAVAWSAESSGSAGESFKVRRQVVVQPDFPRILAPGDNTEAVVALYNRSSDKKDISLSVTTDAALEGNLERELALEAGESRVVSIPLRAGGALGVGVINVEVVGGDAAPYSEEFELAVRPAQSLQTEYESLVIPPGGRHEFTVPAGMMAATVRQKVSCASLPTVDLLAALNYVVGYPYGCLEQTVSGVFPLLPLSALAPTLPAGKSTVAAESPGMIYMALERIASMRRSGGYARWPESLVVHTYDSLYTMHFLVEARRAGYAVGAEAMRHMSSVLSGNMGEYEDYALCVLALAGRADRGRMLRRYEQSDSLTNEQRLLLARALAHGGDPVKAREVRAMVAMPKGLREAAFGLMVELELNPESAFAPLCAREIERERNKELHWGTTQNNSLALMALGKYLQVRGKVEEDSINAAFTIDGELTEAGGTNSFEIAVSGAAEVSVANKGAGDLYVMRGVEGVPVEPLAAVSSGLKVEREWFSADGVKLADGRALKRGELVVVRLGVDCGDQVIDDLIVEDLLPACLEIEDADLRGGAALSWIPRLADSEKWVLHKEARDDRMLLFGDEARGVRDHYYSARVVSAGEFALPGMSATRMYAPAVFARGAADRIIVEK